MSSSSSTSPSSLWSSVLVIATWLAYTLIALLTIGYILLRRHFSYWADRGVVHQKPALFYGNLKGIFATIPLRQPFRDIYAKFKDHSPFAGFYFTMRHAVVILDLDLVKTVLIKDFQYFADRGNYYNERDDPLTGHVLNLEGARWRSVRAKLTPTFTTGKMRFMFPTVVEVGSRFMQVLREQSGDTAFTLEVKDLLDRFTTDVIGSCAFGLECNSLKDPKTKFREMGSKIFTERRHNRVVFNLMHLFPNAARWLRLKAIPDDVTEFFMGVVRNTVEYREREGIQRNDFMNLLIELKNRKDIDGFTLEEIAAEAFVFFAAGFETSSTTMGFCLYELAVNQQIQDKARKEIEEMLGRYDGKFSYEGIRELKYLQQILHETLRMYSIASFLTRTTVQDYKIPNSCHTIEKNTLVIIPADAIHNDPAIYPQPEVFDPERFAQHEVEQRHPMAWLPFGKGPRNCIGLRFGEMQAQIGLAMLLKNFRFSPAAETKIPLEIKIKSFLLASEGGIVLKIEKL